MSSWEVWLIILLVIGVVFSNIAVLKYSAKFKLPPFGQPHQKDSDKPDSQDSTQKPPDKEEHRK
ncbi:DUF2897 family protein [Shewanella yunxiaonensis]|uniref:DUF2897 family protein n=1 Tax=Shewanella yunxiaonensis TaxID=2829809 RepID=A0ABX7YX41_9GAMM|nr:MULTISPECIES: DUF2897 family protein [Shewanella]MDF0534413.1 DUF2897 family protein [Shewanella sp. A32]QUN07397.1 DUF2897 family protein [Shewanella yunxiaonensis]